jgi:adenine-specific DNA-methyltransferase
MQSQLPSSPVSTDNLIEYVDMLRFDAYQILLSEQRANLGQYFTPPAIARFMASWVEKTGDTVRFLDPGAGVGTLTAGFISEVCQWENKPKQVFLTTFELSSDLIPFLKKSLETCRVVCEENGISCETRIIQDDFIEFATSHLQGKTLFHDPLDQFNVAILNPPYKKIISTSRTRQVLREVGIETSNLYTAFLWLTQRLLSNKGQLIAITPRSFCNGPYFRPFRQSFLSSMSLRRIHVFTERNKAFQEDDVLQENIIYAAKKGGGAQTVLISSSEGPQHLDETLREVAYDEVVAPSDPEQFIRIVPLERDSSIIEQIKTLTLTIFDLGLTVSTGRVVDFRATSVLRATLESGTVPLLYPGHIVEGAIKYPSGKVKKPQAVALSDESKDLLVPNAFYVLVKRFSSKEERRRVVAAVTDPKLFNASFVGFENHLNYFHYNGQGLEEDLAHGLAAFLNSTTLDEYFRQFNGHTQVNATDLRNLRYPGRDVLDSIGKRVRGIVTSQSDIDRIVAEEIGDMSNTDDNNALKAKEKITQAKDILAALQAPKAQQNDRSALTLLALLDVKPETSWSEASDPIRGVTEMMTYIREYYGVNYAPNTRETVRRQTIHQFVQMGLVLNNPTGTLPPNSPLTAYRIEAAALKLIREFGTTDWEKSLVTYLATVENILALHTKERKMAMIPVHLPSGEQVMLSGGGQNILIKEIVEKFCPRYTPGGIVVYMGDAGHKVRGSELEYLRSLGVDLHERGKMPDVIIHYTERNWLILIEAVTSHGPMDIKRHNELKQLFKRSKAPLVFATAFMTRKAMVKYLSDIAWETEVWIAEEPTHLIHFNGERFLGPYDNV